MCKYKYKKKQTKPKDPPTKKKQVIQGKILFIVKLLAKVEPSSGRLDIWCCIFWIYFSKILNQTKNEKVLNIYFPLVVLSFNTLWCY